MKKDDIARYLKLPKLTVNKLVRDGRLPGRKIERQWRLNKDAVEAYLKEGTLTSNKAD